VQTGRVTPGTTYSAAHVAKLVRIARAVGGPVSFPIRADLVTPETVAALRPHGEVAVWTDAAHFDPVERYGRESAAIRAFRSMGVNGMIQMAHAQH
jgi:hypothetical protein